MDMLDANHQCPWKTEALALRAELAEIRVLIGQVRNQTESASSASVPAEPVAPVSPSTDQRVAELEHQLEILKRQLFGKKSEKRPAPYKPPMPKADPAVTQQKRRDNAALRDDLPVDEIAVPIKPEACVCKKCGGVPESGGPGKSPSRGSHRSGLADFPHPAPQLRFRCAWLTRQHMHQSGWRQWHPFQERVEPRPILVLLATSSCQPTLP